MLTLSPLEQFNIYSIGLVSNLSFTLMIILISIIFNTSNKFLLSKNLEFWTRSIPYQISQIFILFCLFICILYTNLIGLVPFSKTATVQLAVILSLTIPCFFSINYWGVKNHGFNILYLFLPEGVPLGILVLIVILETFSYIMRLFALTLRLCANLLSGHILVKIFLEVLVSNILISPILVPILFLEFFVACIQSYVFVVLLIAYNNDILQPH